MSPPALLLLAAVASNRLTLFEYSWPAAVFMIIGLALAACLISLPFFYARALRQREKTESLRQFVMRDAQLRQSVLEEQAKKAAAQSSPKKPEAGLT